MTDPTRRRLLLAACLAIALLWSARTSTVDVVLVEQGAAWKYLDQGSNQGTAWRSPGFNDTTWASGPAQLGYGDGDEATLVGYGPNSAAKYVTTYFRRAFTVADPSLFQGLTLRVLRDDGAVVYLNGTEIFRSNMPSGTIAYTTLAPVAASGAEESTFHTTFVSPALLTAGSNVLAVEIHQSAVTSSDVSFDAELVGSTTQHVTRGPYLQLGTPSSMTVRWRTSAPSNSQVSYGLDPSNLLWTAEEGALTTEHEVTVSGLLPSTTYYYAVGSATHTLSGGDANHVFTTAPPSGTATPTRVWVVGDSGTANANARAVRDAYYGFTGSTPTNLWLMLGDNAYQQGLDSEYQAAVFDMYPTMLRRSALWPTLGNHDGAAANSSTQSGPYYNMFTLPTQGEAGGLASGTEAYYSFDYGSIHFVNLESFETNRGAASPMMTWLQNDLASTAQEWIVAFWHHPPYSKGSHDSDVDVEMREMRQNALPILEAAGVDLVLTGHSHSYERSFLIDGHYGLSGTFADSMKRNGGNGRPGGTGAYQKSAGGPAPHEGAVYAVAGSSGQASGGPLNHPAMFVSLNLLGSMVLDIDGTRLDATFLDHTGVVRDSFTIQKGSTGSPPAITTTTLPDGTIGANYNQTLFATGGSVPYTWSLASGTLPAGLTLASSTGVIAGTPAGPAGVSTFEVQVAGNDGLLSTRTLSITILAVPPAAFGKTAPRNGARSVSTSPTISWAASTGATSYEYCYDTSNNSTCNSAWVSTGTAQQATLPALPRTTYYWQVRARNGQQTTLANGGTWWRFTTAR
jgi:hypothetical protein